MDLRKKPEFYKIDPSWAAIDPVPVLSTPTYGEMTAPALVKQLKIQSQKDTKQLAEAKEIAYKEGFYNGTMLVGEYKGEPVQDAKTKVRDSMIKAGLAFAYAEPEGFVLSRSADECVVALMDQWYLDYGEPEWRKQTEGCVLYLRLPTLIVFVLISGLFDSIQVAGQDEHVYPRDATCLPEDFGLAESVGLCANLWFGIEAALGPAFLG
jgi:hypothetical protein